ncbi:CHASE domain-containing protein [Pseudomonas poae]|nr:CHASE domain-containing protein [Pseudomonas poae]
MAQPAVLSCDSLQSPAQASAHLSARNGDVILALVEFVPRFQKRIRTPRLSHSTLAGKMINLSAVCRSYRAISFADGILCAVVLALGMPVTAAVCAITDQLNQAAIKRPFDFAVDERVSRIQRRFVIQTLQLDSLRRFFINADDVTDKEFRWFVTPLINEGESYGWLQRVSEQGLDDLRAKALSDGVSDVSLHERDPATRGRVPIQSRPEHFILLYLVAHDYTDATVSPGMDIVSRPGRLALLQQARRPRRWRCPSRWL